MGFEEQAQKSRTLTREILLKDAASLGLKLLSEEEIQISQKQSSNAAWGIVHALLGGEVTVDTLQIYRFSKIDGKLWIYIQPYSGWIALPSEQALILDGNPTDAIEVPGKKGFAQKTSLRIALACICAITIVLIPLTFYLLFFYPPKSKWKSIKTSAFTTELQGDNSVKKATAKLSWRFNIGRTSIFHSWIAQLYAEGDGRSRLLVRGANLKQVLHLAKSLESFLPKQRVDKQLPLQTSAYTEILVKKLEAN